MCYCYTGFAPFSKYGANLTSFLRTLEFLQMERSTKFNLLGSNNRIFKVLNPHIDFSLATRILDKALFKNNDDWLKNLLIDNGLAMLIKFRIAKKETSTSIRVWAWQNLTFNQYAEDISGKSEHWFRKRTLLLS